MSTTHYVARIVLEKVVKDEMQSNNGRLTGQAPEKRRDVTTIANIVVSAATIEDIGTKASAHLALVDSDEGI